MRINNLIARFLVNKTTKEEWDTLETWKQDSKDNLSELLEMQAIWQNSVDLKDYKEFDKKSAWDLINDKIEEEVPVRKLDIHQAKLAPTRNRKILSLKWAAGIAAAIMIMLFSIFTFSDGIPSDYNHITALGIVESVDLPDGSNIFMNRNAGLSYASNFGENRDIILDGEAYFDVARDEENPFTIKTDHADITVLGTSFNIEEKDDHVDIYVTSGRVQVVSGEEEMILTKNEMVTCKDGKIIKLSSPSRNYLSWKNNKLEFSETPLHLVVSDINRHYNSRLVFSGESKAMNKPVTDVFESEDFESVLETLVLITGIKYLKEGNKYVIQ